MDQEHPMKKNITVHLVPAVLALLVFFTTFPFLDSVLRINSRATNAITWHSVEVANKVVRPGDTIELIYSATINKQCPTDLRGFFVAPDGSVPIRLPTLAGGYTRPSDGPVEIRVNVFTPKQSDAGLPPLKSGEYTYRVIATRYCPDGVEDDNGIPDARFQLYVGP
jgi:hypothetical protein